MGETIRANEIALSHYKLYFSFAETLNNNNFKKKQCLNLILYYAHFSDYLKTFTQLYLRGVFSQLILVNWESAVRWQWRRGK